MDAGRWSGARKRINSGRCRQICVEVRFRAATSSPAGCIVQPLDHSEVVPNRANSTRYYESPTRRHSGRPQAWVMLAFARTVQLSPVSMLLAWLFSEYMQITVEATDRRFRCCGVVLQGGGPFVWTWRP
jgi:hypothetical protein